MKRIRNSFVGVDQGDEVLFSDFEHNGQMWTGEGARERRKEIRFRTAYRSPPAVHVSLSLLDMDSGPNIRSEVTAQDITQEGFQLVFRTWGDSRVARVRMSWMAIGELSYDDDWVISE
jgi:hypothetical protein